MQGEKHIEGIASTALLEMFGLSAEGELTALFRSLLCIKVVAGMGVLRNLWRAQLQRLQDKGQR